MDKFERFLRGEFEIDGERYLREHLYVLWSSHLDIPSYTELKQFAEAHGLPIGSKEAYENYFSLNLSGEEYKAFQRLERAYLNETMIRHLQMLPPKERRPLLQQLRKHQSDVVGYEIASVLKRMHGFRVAQLFREWRDNNAMPSYQELVAFAKSKKLPVPDRKSYEDFVQGKRSLAEDPKLKEVVRAYFYERIMRHEEEKYLQKQAEEIAKKRLQQETRETSKRTLVDLMDRTRNIASHNSLSEDERRFYMLGDIINTFEGYEAYQRALEVHYPEQMTAEYRAENRIEVTENGEVYRIMPDGQKHRLVLTYDRNANLVYALLPSQSLFDNLEKNVWETKEGSVVGLTLEELEKLPISEFEKDLFVLTGYGQKRMETIPQERFRILQQGRVVDELLSVLQTAKDDAVMLTPSLQKALGLEAEVRPTQLFVAVKRYLQDAPVSYDLDGTQIERPIPALKDALYQVRKAINYHPIFEEPRQWNRIAATVSYERFALSRELNMDISEDSPVATEKERRREQMVKTGEGSLYAHHIEGRAERERFERILDDIAAATDFGEHKEAVARQKIRAAALAEAFVPEKLELDDEFTEKLLQTTNAIRAAKGKKPIDDITSVWLRPKEASENAEAWRRFKERLDETQSAYRVKDDKVPYRILDILNDKQVLAERLSIHPRDMEIVVSFEEGVDHLQELAAAQERLDAKKQEPSELQEKARELAEKSKGIFVVNREHQHTLTRQKLEEHLVRNVERVTGSSLFINRDVLDIVRRRAPWMLSATRPEELVSLIGIAWAEAENEISSMVLRTDKERARGFSSEMEEAFVRHLHREYFRERGASQEGAARGLVYELADFVEQYMPDDGSPYYRQQVAAEITRLLSGTARQIIEEEAPYYREALQPHRVLEFLEEREFITPKVRKTPEFTYLTDTQEIADALSSEEELEAKWFHIDRSLVTQEEPQELSEKDIRKLEREFQTLIKNRNELVAQQLYTKSGNLRRFGKLREVFGNDVVRQWIQEARQGTPPKISDVVLAKGFFSHLRKTYGFQVASEVLSRIADSMRTREGLFRGTIFRDLGRFDLRTRFATTEELRQFMELSDVTRGMNITARVGAEEFSLEVTKSGEILARSKVSGLVYQVADRIRPLVLDMDTVLPEEERMVPLNPALDLTKVEAPEGRLPIAVNLPYDLDTVSRLGPARFTGASDIGTIQAMEAFKTGKEAVALDFETTGLLNNQYLMERGLFLPTELYMQEARWENGKVVFGEKRHLVFDVGSQADNTGKTVREIVVEELGSLQGSDIIREVLGEEKAWDALNRAERERVLKDDRIAFLRNLAKYSTYAQKLPPHEWQEIVDFKHVPHDFDTFYRRLVKHATIGLDVLANGLNRGVQVVRDLGELIDEMQAFTRDRLLILQNGADADLAWAKHFAERAGRVISDKPQVMELLHLSRLVAPGERYHSLEAQVQRSGDSALQSLYRAQSHLASADVEVTLRLAEHYLNRLGDIQLEYLQPGMHLAQLSSRGGISLPRGVYRVLTETPEELYNPETGMYELRLARLAPEGEVEERLVAPTLREMQRKIAENFKALHPDEVDQYRDWMAFDNARREIRESMVDYDEFLRWKNRLEGEGNNEALRRLKERYEAIREKVEAGTPLEDLTDVERKILQNENLFRADRFQEAYQPEYSVQQREAMPLLRSFFSSKDAELREKFLAEVENLKAVGAISDKTATTLIQNYNEAIKRKAEELGRELPMREVPGMVDLGRLGAHWGRLAGTPMTFMTNTFNQAYNSVWSMATRFKRLVDPDDLMKEEVWKREALDQLMTYLKEVGIIQDFRPGDLGNAHRAAEALMAYAQQAGPAKVWDVTQPLIQGPDDKEMIAAFEAAHREVLAPVMQDLRPDLKEAYERTKAVRDALAAEGMAVDRFNYYVAPQTEGRVLDTTGPYAYMSAEDLARRIESLKDVEGSDAERRALWREIFRRAREGEGEEREVARSLLGWQRLEDGKWVPNTPDAFIHPIGEWAGTRYADMPIQRVQSIQRQADYPYPELQERAAQYLMALERGEIPAPQTSKAKEAITGTAAETAETVEVPRQRANVYVPEPEFERPTGTNRPPGALQAFLEDASAKTKRAFSQAISAIGGKGVLGLIAAGLAAAFVTRQWTREDMLLPERKPQHDQSPNVHGEFSRSSTPPQAPNPPMHNRTYVTEDQGNYHIKVRAKNPGHIDNDQIAAALGDAMQGRPSNITINHRDDTSSITTEWLREKFMQLLDHGYVTN